MWHCPDSIHTFHKYKQFLEMIRVYKYSIWDTFHSSDYRKIISTGTVALFYAFIHQCTFSRSTVQCATKVLQSFYNIGYIFSNIEIFGDLFCDVVLRRPKWLLMPNLPFVQCEIDPDCFCDFKTTNSGPISYGL